MKYDIAAKKLLEHSLPELLDFFLGIKPVEFQIIEELPQEAVSLNRTDFPVLITYKNNQKRILVIELQTYWEQSKIKKLLQYKLRYEERFQVPAEVVMFLFTESKLAVEELKEENLYFKFTLIKLWEYSSEEIIHKNITNLLPLAPLMADGLKHVNKIEKELYEIARSEKKFDYFSIFVILLTLRDENLSREIYNRRRAFMIQSPIVKLWLEEGREEGIREGKIEDAKKMKTLGADIDFIVKATGLSIDVLKNEGIIE